MPSSAARAAPAVLRFGDSTGGARFELQVEERRLLVDGKQVPLGARAFDLLVALATRPDQLVTKRELLDLVWPGLVVEEGNLQVQISHLRKVLGGDVIATVPGRGYRFTGAVVPSDASAATAPAASSAPAEKAAPTRAEALPAPQLFGRADALARLQQLLDAHACVTLVGTAGVGKTSVARAAFARWPRPRVWVDLAPLAQPHQVAGAVARALGAQTSDEDAASHLDRALEQATESGELLLVLDNAEHLVEPCARIAASLAATPRVRVLVTSQVPLAIAGEQVQRLDPLPVADTDAGDDALALLVQRIVAADHRFVATPERLPLLRAICRHLDGLPLALEMAAARVPAIGLQAVHDAMEQRFSLLTRGRRDASDRHRTLHNALEWSYRLLSEPEQRLFRALGVFAGGFTLDLAVALMTDDPARRWDVVDGIASLVDRSLVVASHDEPPRYRLLETMRAFALEQLALAGEPEESVARRRHARAVLDVFPSQREIDKPGAAWLAEMENAREAIAWARTHDLELAVRLVVRVASCATFSVWRLETTAWLFALRPDMEGPRGAALPKDVQATWSTEYARLQSILGSPEGTPAARRALSLWQSLQDHSQALFAAVVWVRSVQHPGAELDAACAALEQAAAAVEEPTPRERFHVHAALANAALTRGDFDTLIELRFAEARIARELNWQHMIDAADSNVISALNKLGRFEESARLGNELLARVDRENPDSGNMPWILSGLFEALVQLGRLEEARALVLRTCATCRRFRAACDMSLLPLLAVKDRRFEAAAQLVGYAWHIVEAYAATLEPSEEDYLASARAAAVEALGAGRVAALESRGRTLGDEEAAALAAG